MTKTTLMTILLTTSILMSSGLVSQAYALDLTFTPISTIFNNPIGIDHFEPTNEVVMSVNYFSGTPFNFETVASDGTHAPFSTASGFTDEVKIATARDDGIDTSDGLSQGGFVAGTLFTGNGITGQIAKINPDGTVVNPWVTLPGGDGLMRGSLYVDRTGIYGGDLIVVTTGGQVWRVDSSANPTLIADVNVHLEGLITVPNDPQFGTLAGKIIAGAEEQSRVHAFDNSGPVGSWAIPFNIEDIDLIPTNENFFGVNFGTKTLLGVPASAFDLVEGQILVTDEFSPSNESGLALLQWDPNTNSPVIVKIGTALGSFIPGQWEHVTFSSAGIVEIPTVEICGDGIDNDGDGLIDEGCNEPPVAVDDAAMTDEDTSVTIDVIGNDSDPNGDSLTITATTAPSNGSIVDNGDGTITYTPNADYNGPDSFTYTITDGEFDSTATVTIDVKPVNDAPIITAELISVCGEEDEGCFLVSFDVTDVDSVPIVTATLNGETVIDGQKVILEIDDKSESEIDDGILKIKGPEFTLTVTATDGVDFTGTASPTFDFAEECDDEDDEDKHDKKDKKDNDDD